MKYSVVIPTMWKAPQQLKEMLMVYEECPLVHEVLLIDNVGFNHHKVSKYRKVRVLNDGKNLFVNPSWNLGVKEATCERVILANDDIFINEFNILLYVVDSCLKKGVIIGLDKECFAQKRTIMVGEIEIRKAVGERGYGFGVFMVFYKESYIPIPEELKVWYGDTLLYNSLNPYLIIGIDVETKMRTTSRTMDLRMQHKFETKYYELFCDVS